MWGDATGQFKIPDEKFLVPETYLIESYQRCEIAGVRCDRATANDSVQGKGREDFLEKNNSLICKAKRLFSTTLENLQNKRVLFILTDGEGRVVELLSKPELVALTASHGITAGSSFREESLGTNAISLALHHAEPVVLRGGQHFCRIFVNWNCVAIPIRGKDGTPVACLDISTAHEEQIGDKLALANLLAADLMKYFNNQDHIGDNKNVMQFTSLTQVPTITKRQQEVLKYFSQGLTYKEIAQRIGVDSCKTVEKHLDSIRLKLQVKTRRECIHVALAYGLFGPPPPK